jgi:tetratricopeptide (TPR) repeat protein
LARADRRLFPLIAALLFLSGCSIWDSVTSYFNTYYNAARLFTEAEEELWAQPDARFTGRDILAPFVTGQGTRTKFTSVIEKCSKLLQYYSDSKLVDDALMMIGKSYLYQAEYQRAERKFQELLDQYPESDLVLEARFLLAAAYMKMGSAAQARQTAQEVLELSRKEDRDDVLGDVSNLLGRLHLEEKNAAAAREEFAVAAEKSGNGDRRATAYLVVASLDSAAGQFESAETAYRKARQEGSSYVFQYRGRIGEVRMAAAQGRYEDALDELDNLRSNTNFREFFGEVDLETAIAHLEAGELDAAVEALRHVDTAYARTEVSAKAVYRLGLVYEDRLAQYDSARTMYNRGRTIAPAAPVTKEIVRRADYLNRYSALRADIARYDSMLAQLSAPADTAGAEVKSVHGRDADSSVTDSAGAVLPMPPEQSSDTAAALAQVPPDSLATGKRDTLRAMPRVILPRDTVEARLSYAMNELATLFFTSMNRPDSSARWYDRLLSTYPDSRVAPRAMYGYAQVLARDSSVRPEAAESLNRRLVERYPDTEFAAEARRILGLPPAAKSASRAEEVYREAERQFLNGHPEQAVILYRSIARDFPESPFASRAEFAAGFVYEEDLSLPDSAIALYRRLVERYPDSPHAARVRPLIAEVDRAAAPAPPATVDSAGAAMPATAPDSPDSLATPGRPPATAPEQKPESESARRRATMEQQQRTPREEEPVKEGAIPPKPE